MSYDTARAYLDSAGWDPLGAAREFNVGRIHEAGYRTWPAALAVLSHLAGIVVEFTRNGRSDNLWVDPERACAMVFRNWVDDYESRVGSALLPIGFAYDDHMLLLLSEDGRVFGAFDEFLAWLGNDELAAVELLVTNGEIHEFGC